MINQNFFENLPYKEHFDNYFKEIAGTVLICAGAFGGLYFYRSYQAQKEGAAQIIFAECIAEFDRAQKDPAVWPDVEIAARAGYKRHSGTALAPYFLALQAQALVAQDKLNDALVIYDQLLSSIPASSPFLYLYKIKAALVKMDVDALANEGFAELQALAQDIKNTYKDEALFYVGNHYWFKGELDQAKATWKNLVEQFGNQTGMGESPWALRAQEKLNQIP